MLRVRRLSRGSAGEPSNGRHRAVKAGRSDVCGVLAPPSCRLCLATTDDTLMWLLPIHDQNDGGLDAVHGDPVGRFPLRFGGRTADRAAQSMVHRM